MAEPLHNGKDDRFEINNKQFFEYANEELAQYIAELEKVNEEVRNARRAALNMMEDAILSKEALRKSEERLHMAVDAGNIGTCDWNYLTGEMQWNDVRFRLCGIKQQDRPVQMEEFYALVHPDDVVRTRQHITSSIEGSGTHTEEYRVVHPNGSIHWVYEAGRVVERKEGKPYRVISVLFDITERKILEQQKEDFISIASHELKTPVTSIKTYAELLEEIFEAGNYETGATVIKKLNTQVDRLIELVNILLDVKKMAEGQLPLHLEPFNLKELAEECVEDLARLSADHRIIIQSKTAIFVTADRSRISQVLNNLVSNAIKYSPRGCDITINWVQNETGTEVSVRDEGIGISDEIQKRIFERFFREKNAKTRNLPGMGLGLYITADIIHRHAGRIWVESEPGKGSTFHFTLPAIY